MKKRFPSLKLMKTCIIEVKKKYISFSEVIIHLFCKKINETLKRMLIFVVKNSHNISIES